MHVGDITSVYVTDIGLIDSIPTANVTRENFTDDLAIVKNENWTIDRVSNKEIRKKCVFVRMYVCVQLCVHLDLHTYIPYLHTYINI